ncbi:restriction endonuclease subunit S [Ruegeria pomeroyi]|nr:restriction endonuclease subunit S [Ruegeria pomeroyi]
MSWEEVRLGEVAVIERNQIAPSEIVSGTKYVGLEHIEAGGRILGMQSVEPGDLRSAKFRFSSEHVLFGKLRPYLGKISLPTFEGICSTDILPIRPGHSLDRRYLAYFLRQPELVEQANTRSTGANLPRLSPKALADFEIPLPPIDEQRRIAAVLDKADAIRLKREQTFAMTDEFLKSVFLEMFGDPISNPKGWQLFLLGDVGDLDRGKSRHRPRNDPRLLGGPYPFIQTGDVARARRYIETYESTYSEMGLAQSKLWPKGTLCITIAANIADTAVLGFDACFPDSVVGFAPGSGIKTEYVQQWFGFLKSIIEAKAPQSAQRNINLAILRDLELPVPPIEEQERFVEIAAKSSRLVENLTLDISSAEELLGSLSQRAFRGELQEKQCA